MRHFQTTTILKIQKQKNIKNDTTWFANQKLVNIIAY